MQDLKEYKIILSPRVEETLDEIYSYIATNFSESYANNRVNEILDGIETLKIFPEAGFNADKKFKKRIDPKYDTRGMPLKRITLFYIILRRVKIGLRWLIYFQLKVII